MSDPIKPANQPKKTKQLGPSDVSPSNYRKSMQCGCGLWRLLPATIGEGDEFNLVPCPKCGSAPRLRHLGDCVELVQDEEPQLGQPLPTTPLVEQKQH